MSTSNAIDSFGTKLYKEDGAFGSGNWVEISEQVDPDIPEIQTEFDDVTTMNSTGQYRERIPVMLSAGEFTLLCHYLPNDSTHNAVQGLIADQNTKRLMNIKVVLPGAIAQVIIPVYVSKVKADVKMGKAMGFAVSFMPTSQPTMP